MEKLLFYYQSVPVRQLMRFYRHPVSFFKVKVILLKEKKNSEKTTESKQKNIKKFLGTLGWWRSKFLKKHFFPTDDSLSLIKMLKSFEPQQKSTT